MSVRKLFWQASRLCAHCERFGLIDVFCPSCWKTLNRLALHPMLLCHPHLPFPIYALYLWKTDLVKNLVHALKGGRSVETLRQLAVEFLSRRRQASTLPMDPLFIPSPPAVRGHMDHAGAWAEELCRLLDGSTGPFLARVHSGEIKKQSAADRQKIVQLRLEAPVPRQQTVIFVDDIYTTGATARAAYEALGRPPDFEVWVIAYRPKLALHS